MQIACNNEVAAAALCSFMWNENTRASFCADMEVMLLSVVADKKELDRLPRLLVFLQKLQYYPQILVNVVRKTVWLFVLSLSSKDSILWDRFFPIAGDPVLLYRNCLEASDIESAGLYLLVIAKFTPELGRMLALIVLKRSLALGKAALARDTFHFWKSSGDEFKMNQDESNFCAYFETLLKI